MNPDVLRITLGQLPDPEFQRSHEQLCVPVISIPQHTSQGAAIIRRLFLERNVRERFDRIGRIDGKRRYRAAHNIVSVLSRSGMAGKKKTGERSALLE